jgi:hypothetical protein
MPSSGSPAPGSSGLSVGDRRHLLTWLDAARLSGIDATEDLRLRPWPMPVTAHVIGVFRAGMTMATWLVVGQNELWTVVSVSEGTVLATRPTLAAALAIIHSPPPESPPETPIDESRPDTEPSLVQGEKVAVAIPE